jgi:hypothetical protein
VFLDPEGDGVAGLGLVVGVVLCRVFG